MLLTTLVLLSLSSEPPPDAGDDDFDAGVELLGVSPVEAEDDDELEEMRAMEAAVMDPATADAPPPAPVINLRDDAAQLAAGSLTRDRLENALDLAEFEGEELAFELERVTDVEAFDVSRVAGRYDIPVEMQPLVAQYIHFFQGGGRKWFRRWMSRSSRYIPLMQPILEEKGLPRDTVYLSMIESGFNTQARSWARAVGPWQFIPGTAKMFKLRDDFWVDERRDPVKSTYAAASYLGQMHGTLGHWYLAWAGYNTGEGRVRKLIQKYGTSDFWSLAEHERREGYAFAKETKHYVPKLIACALVAKHPEAFGFSQNEFTPEAPFEFDEVKLTDSVDLEVIAQASGAPLDEIQEFNPELKRWCTPPASEKEPYTLRLPKGRKLQFEETFAKYAPAERLHFKIHRVGKGDTLSAIALKYSSATEAILRMNHLTSARMLKLGSDLIVPVPSAQALKNGTNDSALERQVARARRSGIKATRPEDEVPAGTQTASSKSVAVAGTVALAQVDGKTRVTYGIGKGDSLWSIARRFDVHVTDLKEWNPALGSPRGLKVGAAITVWPGPAADLSTTSASR